MTDIVETARPVYGPGSEHNYLLDRLLVAGVTPTSRGIVDSDVDEARTRLAMAEGAAAEQRVNAANVTISVSHGGSDFGNLSPAAHLNAAFTDSYANEIVVEPLFTRNELPAASGEKLRIPHVTTGATVGVAGGDSSSTPTQASPVTAAVDAPVAMVSGLLTVSRQFLDFVLQPGGEDIAGRMLGARFAEAVDSQLWGGSGSSGQTQGIATTSGATANTYVDLTPTVQELYTALLKLRSVTSTARKARVDTAIMHNRRAAWLLEGNAGTFVNGARVQFGDEMGSDFGIAGLKVAEYAGVATNLGGGTEDEILVCRRADLQYWASPPELLVAEDYSGVTSGQVAIAVKGYIASPGGLLQPAGVGILTGSGLAAPSGF